MRLLLLSRRHFRQQTPDTVLKFVVLGSVDEWVDAAVGERQHHGEVVEPRNKLNSLNSGKKERLEIATCQFR